jgi:hypothetical protein
LGLQDSDDEAEAADQASDQVRFILFYWNEFTFNFAVSGLNQCTLHGKKTPSPLLNRIEQCFAAHVVHTLLSLNRV